MRILRAGLIYFALVFGAGFVLGPIRILWAVPRFGTRIAELMEMPIMLIVIVAAARWTVRRFAIPARTTDRLAIGCLALALLLVVEFLLVLQLRGISFEDYLAGRDPVSGTVYYLLLGVFAAMPLVVRRKPSPPRL